MRRRAGGRSRAWTTLLLGTALLAIVANPSAHGASPDRPAAPSAPGAAATPVLSVTPGTWWLLADESVVLAAYWTSVPPGCSVQPEWFDWSVPGTAALGTVSPASAPSTNFTASDQGSGLARISVRSAALLDCGAAISARVSSAAANVSVEDPVTIGNLSVGPNPEEPGSIAELRGVLAGGTPPYTAQVQWGDGSNASVLLTGAGPFAIPHAYPCGSFTPALRILDAEGSVATAAVAEALVVSSDLAIAITPEWLATDVGRPLPWNLTIQSPPAVFAANATCAPDASSAGNASHGLPTACTFDAPGIGSIRALVTPLRPAHPVAAILNVSVRADPTLSLGPALEPSEVGEACPVPVNLTGGVPPFSLYWTVVGSAAVGVVAVPSDGSAVLPVDPSRAGGLAIDAWGVDSVGVTTGIETWAFPVDTPLNASTTVFNASVGAGGVQLAVGAAITGGAPPFVWLVATGLAVGNASVDSGVLTATGTIAWSVRCMIEGEVTLTVLVGDAAGTLLEVQRTVEALEPLRASASIGTDSASSAGSFSIDGSIVGGLAPFSVTIAAPGGQHWNRTEAFDGPFRWNLASSVSGTLNLSWTVTDALGATASGNGSVELASAAPGLVPSATSTSALAAGLSITAVVGAGVGLVALRLRRRARSPAPAPVEPIPTLRAIISPSDGADRATVELLAEEAGIPLETVRATIDQLVAGGTIRSETDADGTEVLSWEREARG